MRDTRGVIAILFGLFLLPMLAAAGGALDYAGAQSLRTQLQTVADRAANDALRDPARSERLAAATVARLCADGSCGPGLGVSVKADLHGERPRIAVALTGHHPTTFLGLIGRDRFDVSVRALAFAPPERRAATRVLGSKRSMRTLERIRDGRGVSRDAVRQLYEDAGVPRPKGL